jgi:hypothetical protein
MPSFRIRRTLAPSEDLLKRRPFSKPTIRPL